MTREKWSIIAPLAAASASALALAAAYAAQYAFDIQPCVLCLYQRIPYFIAGTMALLALVLPAGDDDRSLMMALVGAVFLIGAGLAFYHFGVERHWWAGAAACQAAGKAGFQPLSTAELMEQLHSPPPKPCDQVDWMILGVSVTAWNALASLALAAFSFEGAKRIKQRW